ncbi:hypothetical protein F8G81_01580 [Arthrobacter sp. CDRTa11]|uniref:hypothetical protein n=1 Tax=Arthrobacter sp. CDRTa11 TaxID=2651199 RepID=UPI002265A735|nr:hypothetical protein [Arthrobacter sp. CDRTa11]UZX01453.1 hypothetical protein F8G81_01580 [Arthrobacter sp. CDRTa11]
MVKAQGVAGPAAYADPALVHSARKRTKYLRNGRPVVEATGWQVFGAWAVDFSLIAVIAAVASAAAATSVTGTAGKTAAAAIAVWLAAPWLYGFSCARGFSLGSLATTTVLVRVNAGERPGFWRAGWVMFSRMVLFPIVILVILLAAAGGSGPSGDSPKARHLTLDRRFPVPPPPIHPDVARAANAEAAARHSQLPGLYEPGPYEQGLNQPGPYQQGGPRG